MRAFLIGFLVLLGLLFVGYSWIKGNYNGLVEKDENVKAGWAQVENQLQRRMDLIPNLVNTVKGYASHERETFQAVTEARAKVGQASTVPEKMDAHNGLSSALSRLLLVVERYPDLKANQNFLGLQDELAGTENRIATERRRYNDLVADYNKTVRAFPTNIIAGVFGFDRAELFEAAAGAETAPKVDFETSGAGG